MYKFDTIHLEWEKVNTTSLESYQMGHLSYQGGITQRNKLDTFWMKEGIIGFYIDINGSYVFILSTHLIPYGDPIEKVEDLENSCFEEKCLFNSDLSCDKQHYISMYHMKGKFKIKENWTSFPTLSKYKYDIPVFNYHKVQNFSKTEIDKEKFSIFYEYNQFWQKIKEENEELLKEKYDLEWKSFDYYFKPELEQCLKMYDFVGEKKEYFFKATKDFNPLRKWTYQMRRNCKDNKDKSGETIFKTAGNSSYGKLGQKIQYENFLQYKINDEGRSSVIHNSNELVKLNISGYNPTEKAHISKEKWDTFRKMEKEFKVTGKTIQPIYKNENSVTNKYGRYKIQQQDDIDLMISMGGVANVIAASYITMMGRYLLREHIFKIGATNIEYTDTDSNMIIINKSEINDLSKEGIERHLKERFDIDTDDTQLGKMKLEKTSYVNEKGELKEQFYFDAIKVVATKTYFIFNQDSDGKYYLSKFASGGIKKDKINIRYNDIKEIQGKKLEEIKSGGR